MGLNVLVGAGVAAVDAASVMPASGPAKPAHGGLLLLPLAELPPVFDACGQRLRKCVCVCRCYKYCIS